MSQPSAIMLEVGDLLTIEAAQALILEHVRPLSPESIRASAAAGRVLARDAAAVVDLPPFASSAMDGFAVRAGDTPGLLRVVHRIAAGAPAPRALGPGEAMGIATGGVVPEGADTVAPIEDVAEGDNDVRVERAEAGANVRPRGGDLRIGEVVIEAGTRLGPAHLAALAAAGVAEVTCARRPRAAVVVTGSELRSPGETLEPGQVYEANGALLSAQLESAGASVDFLATVADTDTEHRRALGDALERDLVVSSGGVSVGPHDLVRRIEVELGVEEVFWRVAVKPGKPISFGVRGATLVFGLPGNPVSSLVCFELFVRPAVLALQGAKDPRPRFAAGVLGRRLRRNAQRDELVRARTRLQEGDEPALVLEPLDGQESHMIARAAAADALVFVPRGDGELREGAAVRFLRLGS